MKQPPQRLPSKRYVTIEDRILIRIDPDVSPGMMYLSMDKETGRPVLSMQKREHLRGRYESVDTAT